MKFNIKKMAWRLFKYTGITLLTVVALAFLLPFLFPGAVNNKIKQLANQHIDGNIQFSHTSLSFFHHFPHLTFSLYDVTLMGSVPFEKDTLISASEIAFGIDLGSLFRDKLTIRKIILDTAFINIQADSLGHANYNIIKPSGPTTQNTDTSGGASLGINKIQIINSRLVYNDQSLPMTVNARGFNYTGSGDLSKDVFGLNSHVEMQSVDFYYGRQPYVIGKKVNADLITQIDTRSLNFIFEKNNLFINQLPVQFDGKFGFIKNGYDMDFNILSQQQDLNQLISALPAEYQLQLAETDIKGTGQLHVSLKGKFVASDSLNPDLTLSFQVRDGYIANKKSPASIEHLFLNFETRLPALNMDSLSVNIDSLHFSLGDGHFNSVVRVKGVKQPLIYAKADAELDLHKWDSALGLKPFHLKGLYSLHMQAQGRYATTIRHQPGGFHKTPKTDTVITSIPQFTLVSTFKDGYFKYTKLPQAISNINFNLRASCPDSDYHHISVTMDDMNITALNDFITGYFRLGNLKDWPVDADLKAKIQLDDLNKIYPIDSLTLKGLLTADLRAKGNYLPARKRYPAVTTTINIDKGYILTKYYPHPIDNLEVNTTITDKTGSLAGMNVAVNPVSFTFENEPFMMTADLNNFTNVAYKVKLKGLLNLENIYKVFAIKGYNVTGEIAANLSLKGTQADAVAGHYDKLDNKGKLTVKHVRFTTDMYPKPFTISQGVFSFHQDKMQFDTFRMSYANSVFVLNGALQNVIDYVVKPDAVIKGSFSLQSDQLNVGDFLAFADTSSKSSAATSSSGVMMVPKNLDLDFTADVKKILYPGLTIKDAKGHMTISNGTITLKETSFNLVDAIIAMDADYTGLTPQKATFDYHITANDFDIQKAYKGVKLFHDMATSAASAEGLISLDYKLSGRLNSGMAPVYPSLKGGGVVTAKKIRMHGFGLFNAIGKKASQDSLGGDKDVSKVELKTTIADNIITIERTKIRIAGFRARLEGQVGLDNTLNLKFRLGLPPLGLIGIPMTITGTEDKPDIHVGKGSDDDTLKATKDDE